MDIQKLKLKSLRPDPFNARLHSQRNLAAVTSSLQVFGQVEPLVVQQKTLRVIGGNGRLEAMKALGWTEADCVLVTVTDDQAKALGVALNRTAELAEWDYTQLAALLQDVTKEMPLESLGFAQAELDALIQSVSFSGDAPPTGIVEGEQTPSKPPTVPQVQMTVEEAAGPARLLLTCSEEAAAPLLKALLKADGVLSCRKC